MWPNKHVWRHKCRQISIWTIHRSVSQWGDFYECSHRWVTCTAAGLWSLTNLSFHLYCCQTSKPFISDPNSMTLNPYFCYLTKWNQNCMVKASLIHRFESYYMIRSIFTISVRHKNRDWNKKSPSHIIHVQQPGLTSFWMCMMKKAQNQCHTLSIHGMESFLTLVVASNHIILISGIYTYSIWYTVYPLWWKKWIILSDVVIQ